jgi:hypothetical protein
MSEGTEKIDPRERELRELFKNCKCVHCQNTVFLLAQLDAARAENTALREQAGEMRDIAERVIECEVNKQRGRDPTASRKLLEAMAVMDDYLALARLKGKEYPTRPSTPDTIPPRPPTSAA